MDDVRVVVVDSNAFGNGELRVHVLRNWTMRTALKGVALWIPELVVMELAEHAISRSKEYLEKLNQMKKFHESLESKFDANAPSVTLESVTDVVKSTGAEVVALDQESAAEGVRDQVAQEGGGEKKKGIKTGASDSAWVRSVIRHAHAEDVDPSQMIIVSADKANVSRILGSIGLGPAGVPQLVRDLGELRTHFKLESLGDAEDSVVKFVEEEFRRAPARTFLELLGVSSAGALPAPGVDFEDVEPRLAYWSEQESWVHDAVLNVESVEILVDDGEVSASVSVSGSASVLRQFATTGIHGDEFALADLEYSLDVSGVIYGSGEARLLDSPGELDWVWYLEDLEESFDNVELRNMD